VLGDELDQTLIELVDGNPGMAAIVLETTGVAEPLPIAWAVRRPPVDQRVRLAAVVTLVDALHFVASRSVTAAVDAQVAYADVVLVTKSDLASDHDTAAAIAAVHELAPRALVRQGSTAEHVAWLEHVLADPDLVPPGGADTRPDGQVSPHVHDENCRHLDNDHAHSAHGIDSVWMPVQAIVDLEELEDQLGELPDKYVRIKGIVRAIDERTGGPEPRWIAIHRVGLRVSSEPVDAPEFQDGRIVALGPAVDADALAACIRAATR
jgi:G3E family GTPase